MTAHQEEVVSGPGDDTAGRHRVTRTNWAGNLTYQARDLHRAADIAQVQEIVAGARKLRVLGSRHSFSAIADCSDAQLSLEQMNRVIALDAGASRVRVEGGIRYGDLAPALQARGLALANLASLPHISVVGAAATATHGSGSETGNLATAVTAMDIVNASGDVVRLSREADGDSFAGAAVGLGALGPVVGLTLEVEPTYDVRQTVYAGLSHDVLATEFEAIFASAKSVSVFTDWRGPDANALWRKERVTSDTPAPLSEAFGATAARHAMHPLPGGAAGDCTEQLGRAGPWHERLPHFRMEFTPSNGAEIQAEFFVPREEAARAIAALRPHGERLAPILMISEIRTIAGDDLWLSPAHRGPQVAFHFTFHRDWEAIRAVLPAIEASLAPFGALPHWGKVTTMAPDRIARHFPRLEAFRDLARSFDPEGKFRNDFLDRMVFGTA